MKNLILSAERKLDIVQHSGVVIVYIPKPISSTEDWYSDEASDFIRYHLSHDCVVTVSND